MKFNTPAGTLARRKELLNKKEALEAQIPATIDQAAANKLRGDYRDVLDELELFYDDIQPDLKP